MINNILKVDGYLEMTTIDISDLDFYALIRELWMHAKSSPFGCYSSPPTNEQINQAMDDKYIDYLGGRVIKTYFGNLEEVNTRLYNRDAGEGRFESIVADLRSRS